MEEVLELSYRTPKRPMKKARLFLGTCPHCKEAIEPANECWKCGGSTKYVTWYNMELTKLPKG